MSLGFCIVAVFAGSAWAVEGPTVVTFKELNKGATVHFVDNSPMATLRHGVAFFSPGDELITTNPLAVEGTLVGKIRVICVATAAGNTKKLSSGAFICNGIAKLPGGSLILVGEAGERVTEGAVVGGTGIYAGAQGSFISKADKGGSINTVTLVEGTQG